MIKYYFKIAWRIISRQKGVAFTNILGLGLGMSLSLLIISIVKDQFSFDNFHRKRADIYRINSEAWLKDGQKDRYATTSYPLATGLEETYPFIEKTVRLTTGLNGDALAEGKTICLNGFFTDHSFFEIFTVQWLYGKSALAEPNAIVLSEKTARKFFGDQNPVGKVMRFTNVGDFIVRGVLKAFPGKTHIEFDALGSNLIIPSLEQQKKMAISANWQNYFSTYTYVLVSDKNKVDALSAGLDAMAKKHDDSWQSSSHLKTLRFYLQPFNSIVPGPLLSNNLGRALPVHITWILAILALIVIGSAGFNYSSLFVAHTLNRAKEIGVRKVVGATRSNLVFHFLVQGIVTSLLSLAAGFILYRLFLVPLFKNLDFIREFDVSFSLDGFLLALFIVFALLSGLVSGLVPAVYLSAIKPVSALKDTSPKHLLPRLWIKKTVFLVQLSFALIFTIIIINIYRQIALVTTGDYGLRTKNIVNINLPDSGYEKLRHAFSGINGVLNVSGISHLMGTEHHRDVDVRLNVDNEKVYVQDFSIDENYVSNMGLQLLAGKNFEEQLPADREIVAIVNESFLQRFRLGLPGEAIGKSIIVADSLRLLIRGVVKDFHFKSFRYDIEPLLLRYRPGEIAKLNVQINDGGKQKTLAQLEKAWRSVYNDKPFAYSFFDDDLAYNYRNFKDIGNVFGLVALLSICLCCLGLLGLVQFMLNKREKEIGVRKVFGASLFQIIVLLSRSFFRQLLLAGLIGIPLSALFLYSFLNQFAYRINPLAGYISGSFILLAITFSIVGGRIIRFARSNVLAALKNE